MRSALFIIIVAFVGLGAFLVMGSAGTNAMTQGNDLMSEKPTGHPVATFAGGCFWCTESEFRALDGVLFTEVGYMGGHLDSPTYREITTGKTGHAEIIQITYDVEKTNFKDLLDFFLTKAHDPTQLNRQGVDVGTHYRSAVFYHDEAQKQVAADFIAELDASGRFKKPIATKLEPASTFWPSEDYHQQYYEKYKEKTGKAHIRVLMKNAKKLKIGTF